MRKGAVGESATRGLIGITASIAIADLLIESGTSLLDPKTLACTAIATASLANALIHPRAGQGPSAFRAASGDTLKLAGFGLTLREQELVLGYLSGKRMKVLSRDYKLAPSTVRNALSSAYKKLGISGSAALSALGAKYKIE